MLADVSLTDLMISDPITVHPEDDVERAAQIIYEHKIGGIPVVEAGRLVGIITESDILRTFIDMMGILSSSSRIDVAVGRQPNALKQALQILDEHGGDVINVAMTVEQGKRRTYHFRLSACDTRPLEKALKQAGFTVL
jgi:acetoin utilization protein AcuB